MTVPLFWQVICSQFSTKVKDPFWWGWGITFFFFISEKIMTKISIFVCFSIPLCWIKLWNNFRKQRNTAVEKRDFLTFLYLCYSIIIFWIYYHPQGGGVRLRKKCVLALKVMHPQAWPELSFIESLFLSWHSTVKCWNVSLQARWLYHTVLD